MKSAPQDHAGMDPQSLTAQLAYDKDTKLLPLAFENPFKVVCFVPFI